MANVFSKLVGFFDTQQKTAQALGVDQSTVSGWVRGKYRMSPAVAIRAEKETAGKFTRKDLCPDFPWDEAAT